MVREATDICLRVLKESNKSRFDSFSRYEQCIDHIPYYLSGLSHAHFFRQPFSKQLYTVRTLRLTIISPFGTLSRGLGDKGIWRELRVPPKKSWLRPCLCEMQHENTWWLKRNCFAKVRAGWSCPRASKISLIQSRVLTEHMEGTRRGNYTHNSWLMTYDYWICLPSIALNPCKKYQIISSSVQL